jgi:hypothetical protein
MYHIGRGQCLRHRTEQMRSRILSLGGVAAAVLIVQRSPITDLVICRLRDEGALTTVKQSKKRQTTQRERRSGMQIKL